MKKIGDLCPSARARHGALLVGIVQGDGTVAFLEEKVVVDPSLFREMTRGRDPEYRFRFASGCRRDNCLNWENGGCGLLKRAESDLGLGSIARVQTDLPACSIRERCVWYSQHGAEACNTCRYVVTKVDSEGQRDAAFLRE
jgi:hypothetical protein